MGGLNSLFNKRNSNKKESTCFVTVIEWKAFAQILNTTTDELLNND